MKDEEIIKEKIDMEKLNNRNFIIIHYSASHIFFSIAV